MRTLSPTALALSAVLVATTTMAACPGAQVKGGGGGGVNVALRRIDVVDATFDKMRLAIVLAIENGSDSDVKASADLSIAIAGEGKGEESDASADEGEGKDGEAKLDEGGAGGVTLDGQRFKGSASGTASANNTSEMNVVIELPLPQDPAVKEQVVGWQKMLVHIEGNVTVGMSSQRIGGTREVAPPHLPDVILKEAQVASQDGGQSGAGFFKLLLDNKNPFTVTVDKFAWSISIKGKELKALEEEAPGDKVPGSAVAEYSANVDIDDKAFGKDLKALLKSPTVPYVIDGFYEVQGLKKTFHFDGEMKFAR